MSVELIVNFAAALIGIIALLALMPALLRWFQNNPRFQGLRGQGKRLDVIEAKMIDTRRRLILVRRDNEEHLLLIGGDSDIVIEKNIPSGAGTVSVTGGKNQSVTRGQHAEHQN